MYHGIAHKKASYLINMINTENLMPFKEKILQYLIPELHSTIGDPV